MEKKDQKTRAGLRREIKSLDRKLVEQIRQRAELSRELAELQGTEFELPSVELGKIRETEIVPVLRELESYCEAGVVRQPVAYLGPRFSYSYLAAKKQFGEGHELQEKSTIQAVFHSVCQGQTKFGIVPLENSTDGRIADTLAMFVQHPVVIYREVYQPIQHCLLAKGDRNSLTEIRSKAEALSQCRKWLEDNLPKVKLVPAPSSSEAAEMAAKQTSGKIGAIAALAAAKPMGLNVIEKGIEDVEGNTTRFAVIIQPELSQLQLPGKTKSDKTSLLFEVLHQPGSLADVMAVFKRAKINLTWIESIPKRGVPHEYTFYMELEGHRDEARVRNAFAKVQNKTHSWKVLGSYPDGGS